MKIESQSPRLGYRGRYLLRKATHEMQQSKFRFGIGFLFFITSCVAGYLAAYNFGIDEIRQRLDRRISTRTYDLRDLISPIGTKSVQTDLATLRDLIVFSSGTEWTSSKFKVIPFPSNGSLIVTQTGRDHRKLQILLDQLRDQVKQQRKLKPISIVRIPTHNSK